MSKKAGNIILLILGSIIAISAAFLNDFEEYKLIIGIISVLGFVMIGIGGSNLIVNNLYIKKPEEMKQLEIDASDERSVMIRNKAKAKVADIIQWLIVGIAVITIVLNASIWLTLAIVGLFLSKTFLEIFYITKFEKEL